MTPFQAPQLMMALPELMLTLLALVLLVLGVAGKKENYNLVARLSVVSLLTVCVLSFFFYSGDATTFGGMFIIDRFAVYMKVLIAAGSAVSLLMATRYLEREGINRIEYPVLILFSTLGMMMMISANDLISLYMALELQSLPLYVMASIQRDNVRSTEAGLKYFVLGALSSGLLLYGSSLIYGFTGATGFDAIAETLLVQPQVSFGVVTGMVMIIAGMAFKISAVPFHMWAPDVYEGAPTSVTAFFAIVPKAAAIALFARVLTGPFVGMDAQWVQVVVVISMASMILGAVAAVVQTNIKRLLAYSAIGHMGYALIGLATNSPQGIYGLVLYMTLYMATSIGVFCIVLMMKQKDKMVENISDLAGLAKQQPRLALAMSIMMFSMAGIPPLAGFFGKLFVFQAAVHAQLYTLAIVGVLSSVVGAYYYLRIIKVMYFDETTAPLDRAEDRGLNLMLLASTAFVVFFIAMPGPLMNEAAAAAMSLMK